MNSRYSKLLIFLIAGLCVFWVSACATGDKKEDDYLKNHKTLSKRIKLFNQEFETRSNIASDKMVKDDHREEFLKYIDDIHLNILFNKSTIISIKYYQDGLPISQNSRFPKENFNKAVLSIKYEIVVHPSSKLKTLFVKQPWELLEIDGKKKWVVIPEMDVFLNKKK